MPARPKPTVLVIVSLGLAILADLLLRQASWGLNVGLWAIAVASVVAWARRPEPTPLTRTAKLLGASALGFALLFSLRDSNALKIADGLAAAYCVGAFLLATSGRDLRTAPLARLLLAPFSALVSLAKGFSSLAMAARDERTASPESERRGKAVMRGLLLAAPLVLVFGALFASADAVFRASVENLGRFDLDFETVDAHVWTFLVGLTFVGGLLRRIVLGHDRSPEPASERMGGKVGIIEVGIVLGSLVVLFGAFVIVQFRFLFGAQDVVRATHGLSYAEYARGGFFQLVCVAALALAVLVGSDALLKRERAGDEAAYRGLGRTLVVMVFCIVASALLRMKLYTDAFGLTELRIYSTAFMAWLALALAWLLSSTLRGRPERLGFGMLVAGLFVILGTNVLNPDALIVRTNLSKPKADFAYLRTLSDDAALAIRDMDDAIPLQHRAEGREWVRRRASAAAREDWRELNLARWSLAR